MAELEPDIDPCSDEAFLIERPIPPCCVVIFGATGDLTHRKLMPALFSLEVQGLLPEAFRIIAFARRDFTDDTFRQEIRSAMETFAPDHWKEGQWDWSRFAARLSYHRAGYDEIDGFQSLKQKLESFDEAEGTGGNRLFYLATPPGTYSPVIRQLGASGLAGQNVRGSAPFARIVVEKPFGSDLTTARALNGELKAVFGEDQIYRIDHYLGKETVQNIFVFRFANAIFEPLWNGKYVDNVQVTVAETVGVESRAGYFDHAGELRDMVQSHALQMLSLVAMEPPNTLGANDMRDEKVKVLRAMKALDSECCRNHIVRAQYRPGRLGDGHVIGYREEPGVGPGSMTDTFVALKLEIQNWRWSGVPFYVRAGKRMPERLTEVVVTFKNIPPILLAQLECPDTEPNRITIRVQPNEGITMRLGAKPPGQRTRVKTVEMNFTYGSSFGGRIHDAYERLLMDALLGDAALFTRDDEAEAEWALITPILENWETSDAPALAEYPAGTWGPREADALLSADGRKWWNP